MHAGELSRTAAKNADAQLVYHMRLYFATETYQKYLSKKKLNEALDEAEKLLPIDALGVVMIVHGEEYPDESVFGVSWKCYYSMLCFTYYITSFLLKAIRSSNLVGLTAKSQRCKKRSQ